MLWIANFVGLTNWYVTSKFAYNFVCGLSLIFDISSWLGHNSNWCDLIVDKANMSWNVIIVGLQLVCTVLAMYAEEHKSPTYLEGRVGGFVTFNCKYWILEALAVFGNNFFRTNNFRRSLPGQLEFPNEHPIPYHLHWRKDVSES